MNNRWFSSSLGLQLGTVLAAFLLMIAAVGATVQYSARSLSHIQNNVRELTEGQTALEAVERTILARRLALVDILVRGDEASRAKFDKANQDSAEAIETLLRLPIVDRQIRADAVTIQTASNEWMSLRALPLLAKLHDLGSHEERMQVLVQHLTQLRSDARQTDLSEPLARLTALVDAQVSEARARRDRAIDRLNEVTLTAGIAVILATLLVYAFLYRRLGAPIRLLAVRMKRLAEQDRKVQIPFQDRADEIGDMSRALLIFKNLAEARAVDLQVKKSVTELSLAIQEQKTLKDFADAALRTLAPHLKAGVGVFYAFDEPSQRLALYASYGYRARKHLSTSYALGEGLVGQSALERKQILLSPVPEDYIRIHSGTGEAVPRLVLVTPVLLQDRLIGVMEFASFEPFDEVAQRLVDEAPTVVSLPLENLRRALRTRDLLEQSQRQTEELQAADEELRAQQDELQATNEELERRSDELVAQGHKLEEAHQLALARAEALERANQYKSRFLANMSHELRTPLNSMLILAQDLSENAGGNLGPDQVEAANVIHTSGVGLLRLINDILDLSKIEAGKQEAHRDKLALASFCQGLERSFRPLAQQKGLDFALSADPALPPTIWIDGGKLEQIATNLIGNALKFTAQGAVSVAIAPADQGRSLGLTVRDTGIGIPAEMLETVFEPFEQVDGSNRRQYGGTGLGLAISRQLAGLLGGELTVESREGAGSVFCLTLPLEAADAPAAVDAIAENAHAPVAAVAALARRDETRSAPLPKPAPGILVITDAPGLNGLVGDLVTRLGLEAIFAQGAEKGLEQARRSAPAAIILDLDLAQGEGWQILDRLSADPRTRAIPVHVIAEPGAEARARDRGAAGLLAKPARPEAIMQLLQGLTRTPDAKGQSVLVIEDDPGTQLALAQLLARSGIETSSALSAEEALKLIGRSRFDCLILDLGLPGLSGFDLLERLTAQGSAPPVVIYSARELLPDELLRLRGYTDSIIVKGEHSQKRLLDEVAQFLDRLRPPAPGTAPRPRLAAQAPAPLSGADQPAPDEGLACTLLLVDDDMRNIYALAKVLRARGIEVILAQDGAKALSELQAHPEIQIVLMDMMMPNMDGYEAMGRIRAWGGDWTRLPIIALTAKAMKEDREKCLAAGASDYLTKPVDVQRLMAMIRGQLGHG